MEIRTLEVAGLKHSLMSMRNPMNSWHLIDSGYEEHGEFLIGEKDLGLAQRLIKAGNEHMKFMRQIQVWVNMDMTRFFWSEFDTYKFNTKNSCSTIHKLLNPKNKVTIDMFDYYEEDLDVMLPVINRINEIREKFLSTSDYEEKCVLKRRAKVLLFEGFLQLRTVNTNYAEIRNIVHQRKGHQMKKDWIDTFCKWTTTLPYAKELIYCGMEEYYDKFVNLEV